MIMASFGGGNVLHGHLFEFLRNDILDTRNPFANRKLAANFTLNFGVRYSFFNVFHETQGRRRALADQIRSSRTPARPTL